MTPPLLRGISAFLLWKIAKILRVISWCALGIMGLLVVLHLATQNYDLLIAAAACVPILMANLVLTPVLNMLGFRRDKREAEAGYCTGPLEHSELPLLHHVTGQVLRPADQRLYQGVADALSIQWYTTSDRQTDASRAPIPVLTLTAIAATALIWSLIDGQYWAVFALVPAMLLLIMVPLTILTFPGHFSRRRELRRLFENADIFMWQRCGNVHSSYKRLWSGSHDGGQRPLLRAAGSLVLTNQGITFWQGSARNLNRIAMIPWGLVTAISMQPMSVYGELYNGLRLEVVVNGNILPFDLYVYDWNGRFLNPKFEANLYEAVVRLNERYGGFLMAASDRSTFERPPLTFPFPPRRTLR